MSMNGFSNNQLKKQAAEYHNKKRKERLELEEYRRKNSPQSKPRRNRGSMSEGYSNSNSKRKVLSHMAIMTGLAYVMALPTKD